VACEDDTLRIYNVANPRSPVLVGSCRDSCDLFMTQAGNYCYLVHVSGVNIVDVSNPANPHRAGHIGGGEPLAVYVRDTLCYVTVYQYGLRVWNISDIGAPQQLGSLPGPDALDIGMAATCDTVVYTPTFDIISVAQSTSPRLLGHVSGPGGYGVGIVPALGYGLVAANAAGLVAMDIRNPAIPAIDTAEFRAGSVVDIDVVRSIAFLASDHAGMATLDLSNPALPKLLGRLALPRTNVSCRSVVADDSFAFLQWYQVPEFRSVDVSDPARPTLAGGADVLNPPEDMVLRDSFVYVAELAHLQVVNVARPREPVRTGSCELTSYASDLHVADTVAFLSGRPLTIVSVAQAGSPRILSTWSRGVAGLDVVDTVLYAVGQNAQFWTLSVADPTDPRPLDSLHLPSFDGEDVVVIGSTAYASENVIRVVDVSDPANLRLRGAVGIPYWSPRLVYAAPYLYACCAEGGICILETLPTGVAESKSARPIGQQLVLSPSVTTGRLTMVVPAVSESKELTVYDVAGKEVLRLSAPAQRNVLTERWPVDLSRLSAGVYVLRLDGKGVSQTGKVVLTRR